MEFQSSAVKAIPVTIGVAVAGLCVVGIVLITISLISGFDVLLFLGILGAAGGVPIWTLLVWLRRRLLGWIQGKH